MNRSRLLFVILSLALVLPLLSTALLRASDRAQENGEDSLYKYLSVFTDVLSLVRRVYVEQTDMGTLMAGALDGAVDALDPFSVFVPADRVEVFLGAQAVGRSHSGLVVAKERGVAFVVAVEEASPAAEAGLIRSDIISKLQGRSTRTMPLWEIHQILAGDPGSQIELELIRRGEPMEAAFELATYPQRVAVLEESEGLPVLRIFDFSVDTPHRVRELLTEESGERLLVDLRSSAGGDPEVAYQVAGLFVEGDLGVLKGREGAVARFHGSEETAWKGELAVLINGGTQGAAEVLATVLQQIAGATLVGESSFGHAGQSTLLQLSSGARLQITSAFYTGPDEEPINRGLTPDLEVGRDRPSFAERTSLDELILERGVKLLLDREELPAKNAA